MLGYFTLLCSHLFSDKIDSFGFEDIKLRKCWRTQCQEIDVYSSKPGFHEAFNSNRKFLTPTCHTRISRSGYAITSLSTFHWKPKGKEHLFKPIGALINICKDIFVFIGHCCFTFGLKTLVRGHYDLGKGYNDSHLTEILAQVYGHWYSVAKKPKTWKTNWRGWGPNMVPSFVC